MTRGYLYRHEGARCPVGEVRREWKVADGVTLGLSCGRRRREGGDGGSLSPSPLHERERRGEGAVVTATDQEEQGLGDLTT